MDSQTPDQLINFPKTQIDLEAVTSAYNRAHDNYLAVKHDSPDRLRLEGQDRLDLLERLTTNSFVGCRVGDHLRTMILEANGRLIDLLDVFLLEDQILVATSPGRGRVVHDWLALHIFFQDEVSVELMDPWTMLFGLYGPDAGRALSESVGKVIQVSPNRFQLLDDVIIMRSNLTAVDGYEVYGLQSSMGVRFSKGAQNLADSPAYEAFEALRVEAGVPQRGHEIKPGIIPLEAGLTDAVSFSKGCYVGQEVIARLESRGELASVLSGIQLSEAAEPGAELVQSEKTVGTLTSNAYSPDYGWIGLGFVKPRRRDPASDQVTVDGRSARLRSLPFTSA